MAYCGPRGIPHSEFLRWSDSDRQKAVAWQVHESRRCGGCGTHPDEWNPEAGGSHDAYRADIHICQGCVELERLRDAPDLKQNIRGVHLRLTSR